MAGTVLVEMVAIVFPLLLMVVCALGFYALGKWLRKRGYGARLDVMSTFIAKFQLRSSMMLAPWAVGVGRIGYAFSRLPLLGSKRQQKQWDELEARMRNESGISTKH